MYICLYAFGGQRVFILDLFNAADCFPMTHTVLNNFSHS